VTLLQYKLHEENSYHVKNLEIEMSKDKPVSVMIDSDASNIVENVIRYSIVALFVVASLCVCVV